MMKTNLTQSEDDIIDMTIKFVAGPIIGTYMGRPIYDYLIDNFGVKRVFTGIAPSPRGMPPRALFAQGLVYSIE